MMMLLLLLLQYLSRCHFMGSQLKGIKLNQIYQSQITILYLMYASNSFTNCYHSVNEISLGLAQNDPIKWRLLDHEDLIKYLNVM